MFQPSVDFQIRHYLLLGLAFDLVFTNGTFLDETADCLFDFPHGRREEAGVFKGFAPDVRIDCLSGLTRSPILTNLRSTNTLLLRGKAITMFGSLEFISREMLRKLWSSIGDIQRDKSRQLIELSDEFGDIEFLARYYIEPYCQHTNPADFDEEEPISFVVSPVFSTINRFLNREYKNPRDGRNVLFVLSDAGLGKTSLLVMLKLSHLTSFWPQDYECVLLKVGSDTNRAICELKNKSKTILLLDALDEDPLSWKFVDLNLRELLKTSVQFRRVILSCRTQFFTSPKEDSLTSLGQTRIEGYTCPLLYLSPFDEHQVNAYLEKRFAGREPSIKSDAQLALAKSIANRIGSLAFRPLLLSHIDDLLTSETKIANEYVAFETLLQIWIQRETRKILAQFPASTVTCETLLKACLEIAAFLHAKGRRHLKEDELKALMQSAPELKFVRHMDIGGRSLLNRNSVGEFRFSHFVIQEFILAHGLLTKNYPTERYPIRITDKIYGFLASAGDHAPGTNGLGVCPPILLQGLNLSKCVIETGAFVGANFTGALLIEADMSGLDFEGATFQNADLTGADLSGSKLSRADFEGATLMNTKFCDAVGIGINFSKVKGDCANFSKAEISASKFTDAKLRGALFQGSTIRTSNFEKADLSNAMMQEGSFIQSSFSKSDLTATDFSDAQLGGADFLDANLSATNFRRSEGLSNDHRGVVFRNTIMPDGSIRSGASVSR